MKKIGVKLTVSFYKENGKFIAYSPAFDISTCGASLAEAEKNFAELTNIFLEDIIKMGTMDKVLMELGWKKIMRPKPSWVPPVQVASIPHEFQIPIAV